MRTAIPVPSILGVPAVAIGLAIALPIGTAGPALAAEARTFSQIQAGGTASEGCKFIAHLGGDQEVPARETPAKGRLDLDPDSGATEVVFRLTVANINNVVAAHLHLAPIGQVGPVIASLMGPVSPGGGPTQGEIAQGRLTEAALMGPLAGQAIASLLDVLRRGVVYVDVHTNDGVEPPDSGPGDFPEGEIRGQVRPFSHECAGPLLHYFYTCGTPVCFGFQDDPDIPNCTTQQVGDLCFSSGEICEIVGNDCDVNIVCAKEDPTLEPPGCPISRAALKRDVKYLGTDEVRRLYDQVLSYRLATYRYRTDVETSPERLGFLIDDVGQSLSVSPDGLRVDLYAYTSMAVAALQEQSRLIEALARKVEALEQKMETRRKRTGKP